MALTRDFRQTILARAQRDPRFRAAMLAEAVSELLSGDLAAGKAMLCDYANATLGFERLALKLAKPGKSLQRMLGPRGNPTAESLFGIIRVLQAAERVRLEVRSRRGRPEAPRRLPHTRLGEQ